MSYLRWTPFPSWRMEGAEISAGTHHRGLAPQICGPFPLRWMRVFEFIHPRLACELDRVGSRAVRYFEEGARVGAGRGGRASGPPFDGKIRGRRKAAARTQLKALLDCFEDTINLGAGLLDAGRDFTRRRCGPIDGGMNIVGKPSEGASGVCLLLQDACGETYQH